MMVRPRTRPYVCSCGRAFTRNENLKRHKKSNHSGATARNFACQKCHSKFARRDVCKRHQDSCSQTAAQVPQSSNPALDQSLEQPDASQSDFFPQAMGFEDGELNIDPQLSEATPAFTEVSPGQISQASREDDRILSPYVDDAELLINSYFENFHPALPILHKPTFTIVSTPPSLLKVMEAIGALYLGGDKSRLFRLQQLNTSSQTLWKSSVAELEKQVQEDQHQFQIAWVLQSWILCVIYGTFTGTEKHITKARNMYRYLVDAARDHQLLHQRLMLPVDLLWTTDLDVTNAPGERLLTQKWLAYINQESLKLSLYSFYFLDFHLFAAGNLRPSLLSTEFEWDLPWATEIWEAENANDWWSSVSHHEKDILRMTTHVFADTTYRDRDYQAKSVLAATQAILSDCPSKRLMSMLENSSFATLCVVANLESLVRDFTRCYYQLPTNLTDPSPFHVLTQRQNAQVAMALTNIWRIMGDGLCTTCSDDCRSLWHAVRIGCLSIKASMSKPDDLLVGGIVECNPTAGLATSAHLTLGNYVTPRRSGLSLEKAGICEDGIIALLDDLLKAMFEMSVAKSIPHEGPWTFIQGFKLLLILWRALRISILEISNEPGTPAGKYPKLSRQGRMVVIAVASATRMYNGQAGQSDRRSQDHRESEESDVEADYMQWMHLVCTRRAAWNAGHAMSEVLDEIAAMTTDPVSLRR